ncbi:hypothetical protein [Fodinicola feengrottensis]|uniref:Type VII secretion protein EccE n=2 Tax=Fodinicola feengrottensis TaxID=435914 RepID=A0ABN2IIC4_9ACTN|nr:hypothetical protein [Fodinicola feengrottensis]
MLVVAAAADPRAVTTPRPMVRAAAAPAVIGTAVRTAGRTTSLGTLPGTVPMPATATRTTPVPRPPIARPAAPAPAGPVRVRIPIRQRATGIVEQLSVTQAVCWQIAVLSVIFTLHRPWPVIATAATAAVLLLIVTTVRLHGHWLYEHAVLRYQFLSRNRRFDLPNTGARALALVERLLPGTSIRSMDAGTETVMVMSQRHGLTAMIKPAQVSRELVTTFPSPTALLPHPDSSTGVSTEFGVQTVYHSGTRPGEPPRMWLAVHADRTADTPIDDDLALALRNALRRIRKALRRAGVDTEPLADEAALATIAALAHVTGGRHEVRENWRFLATGVVSQACFRLDGWHKIDDTAARSLTNAMVNRHRGTAAVAITLTCYARSQLGEVSSGALVRLAATTEGGVNATSTALAGMLHPAGVGLTRLDGEHAAGLTLSLPIGGFGS